MVSNLCVSRSVLLPMRAAAAAASVPAWPPPTTITLNSSELDENDNLEQVVGKSSRTLLLLNVIDLNLTSWEQVNILMVKVYRVLKLISRSFALQVFFFEGLFSCDGFHFVLLRSFDSFSFGATSHCSVLKWKEKCWLIFEKGQTTRYWEQHLSTTMSIS